MDLKQIDPEEVKKLTLAAYQNKARKRLSKNTTVEPAALSRQIESLAEVLTEQINARLRRIEEQTPNS